MNLSDSTARNRSSGISYQRLLDTDTHPCRPTCAMKNPFELPPSDLGVARYISREFFFDLEVD